MAAVGSEAELKSRLLSILRQLNLQFEDRGREVFVPLPGDPHPVPAHLTVIYMPMPPQVAAVYAAVPIWVDLRPDEAFIPWLTEMNRELRIGHLNIVEVGDDGRLGLIYVNSIPALDLREIDVSQQIIFLSLGVGKAQEKLIKETRTHWGGKPVIT